MNDTHHEPFNSPLETGIRSVAVLVAAFPAKFDLQRLVEMDYLVVHSGDADGPESLHAPLPMRMGELMVRREIIERGLLLMISRGLIERTPDIDGFNYQAGEVATPFMSSLTAKYSLELMTRAHWVANRFENSSTEEIRRTTNTLFEKWASQFLPNSTKGH